MVKPYIYDKVKPFFRLFGKDDHLGWHENTDPSTHNYQHDNRLQTYRFLARHFGLGKWDQENPVDHEIQDYEELVVGLPEDNLTILGLARELARRASSARLAAEVHRNRRGEDRRSRLRSKLRQQPVEVEHPRAFHNTKNRGVETVSYRIHFDDGLAAAAFWGKAINPGGDAPASLVLLDSGKAAAAAQASSRINRGEQVLVVDLVLTGEAEPRRPKGGSAAQRYTQLLATIGERPLGVRTSHLLALARWLKRNHKAPEVRIEAQGPRSQVVALIAAALDPQAFTEIRVQKGIESLAYLLDKPVPYGDAPELFCLGLYPEFDLGQLVSLAEPTRVR